MHTDDIFYFIDSQPTIFALPRIPRFGLACKISHTHHSSPLLFASCRTYWLRRHTDYHHWLLFSYMIFRFIASIIYLFELHLSIIVLLAAVWMLSKHFRWYYCFSLRWFRLAKFSPVGDAQSVTLLSYLFSVFTFWTLLLICAFFLIFIFDFTHFNYYFIFFLIFILWCTLYTYSLQLVPCRICIGHASGRKLAAHYYDMLLNSHAARLPQTYHVYKYRRNNTFADDITARWHELTIGFIFA